MHDAALLSTLESYLNPPAIPDFRKLLVAQEQSQLCDDLTLPKEPSTAGGALHGDLGGLGEGSNLGGEGQGGKDEGVE